MLSTYRIPSLSGNAYRTLCVTACGKPRSGTIVKMFDYPRVNPKTDSGNYSITAALSHNGMVLHRAIML